MHHLFQDTEGGEYKVGVSPHGIVIYRGKLRIGLYNWPRIDVINFKGKEIIFQVRDKYVSLYTSEIFSACSTIITDTSHMPCSGIDDDDATR